MITNVGNILRGVTVEPVMVLYYTSLAVSTLSGQNLVLQKACHPGDIVPSPTAVCGQEQNAQKLATNIETWKHLIVLFVPGFFTLFAGPWSDKHLRRKPLLYLPLCGQIISDLLSLLNVRFWSFSPVLAALSQSVPASITGWRSCFIIGAGSYIADITSEQCRTIRLGINTSIYFLGTPIGAFIFGIVFHRIGFYGVFFMCLVFNSAALVYLYFFVLEIEGQREEPKMNVCEGFLDVKQVLETVKTVFKKRDGYGRAILLLLVLAAPLTIAPLQGEFSVYYFFLRIKFNWNESDFGFYAGIKFIVIFVGTLITLGLFSQLLQISDAVIGMMASVTLSVASLGFAFSTAVWQLYLFCFVDFMHGAGLAVVFSIISKIVQPNELGKINSLVGIGDAIYPLINIPLYTQLYNHTFTKIPGAIFFLSCAYGFLALVIFGAVSLLQRHHIKTEKPQVKAVS